MTAPRILRVFPRHTSATPTDELARVGFPPPPAETIACDEVHVSVTFTWDRPLAEEMHRAYMRAGYPNVRIGGPAYGDPGHEFVPGRYLAPGHVITSRGCNNRCHRCLVPEREGPLRLIPITWGHILHDNNVLQCDPNRLAELFLMLDWQSGKGNRPEFTGGLQASLLQRWHAAAIRSVNTRVLFLAYDRPEQREPVERAVRILREVYHDVCDGTFQRLVNVYCLWGFDGDTPERAIERFKWITSLTATPFPMFYEPAALSKDMSRQAQRRRLRNWSRPAAVYAAKASGVPVHVPPAPQDGRLFESSIHNPKSAILPGGAQ